MPDPNLLILEDAAEKLRPLLEEIVFVGGATLGIFLSDLEITPARATVDVDVIAEITTYIEYFDFSERLRKCGFKEDAGEHPLNCRWLHGDLILDVMPVQHGILLASVNRWYKGALPCAQTVTLPNGLSIRVISAPYFLGTKMEAFRGRGNRDYWSSRDLEDCVAVIDGREPILAEVSSSAPDLRSYLAEAMRELLSEDRFLDALPGYLLPDEGSQQRLGALLRKLKAIFAL
jgi:predicted nucleotidyltransferase